MLLGKWVPTCKRAQLGTHLNTRRKHYLKVTKPQS